MRSMALVVLVSSGCGLVSFDVTAVIPEQTVPGSPLGGILPSFLAAPVPLQVDLRQETQRRSTGPARTARLSSITLAATPHDSPSGNFDFLDQIHVYVDSANDSSLPKREVAKLEPVPRGQTSLSLAIVPDVELLPYINQGAEISAQATGRQPTREFHYDGVVVIKVGL